ncbi:hypothetical protein LSH36_2906g00001 [Paralvinella palmiformis]|uniref:CUB domain-containing protein n=1 Tax=Paralvinella palmiformis TaxID=53620 RepID=A0AAD9IP14_9ANNE|nr:hypothetical protein LSH36_2906g00001 [Paralvinella palmiformis]
MPRFLSASPLLASTSAIQDSRYPENIRCEWLITNYDPNQEIEIGFANFSLETCTACDCDYLKVYAGDQRIQISFYDFQVEDCCSCDYMEVFNGPSSSDRIMGRWFGEDLPAIMTSHELP